MRAFANGQLSALHSDAHARHVGPLHVAAGNTIEVVAFLCASGGVDGYQGLDVIMGDQVDNIVGVESGVDVRHIGDCDVGCGIKAANRLRWGSIDLGF